MAEGTLGKIVEFIVITLLIYGCYISSGVYHQKILKHQYVNDNDKTESYFNAPIIFTFFPQILCTIIGFFLRLGMQNYLQQKPVHIPAKNAIVCSLVINLNMLTYNKAVIAASFSAVVMVKSCSLLSVIMVALFCSRVKKQSLKLGISKIWIGLLVTIGIILFNYYKINEGGNDQPIALISSGLLFISLLGDGVLPDLQAQIKSQYNPESIDMYYHINRYTALIAFVYMLVTLQIKYVAEFIINHSQFRSDLIIYSFLNAFGQLVIYRMVKSFKQHIPAFIIAIRKCFTVIVNIIYFGHQVNYLQGIGMSLVFVAVIMEVYENYKEKVKKQEQKQQISQYFSETKLPQQQKLHEDNRVEEEILQETHQNLNVEQTS